MRRVAIPEDISVTPFHYYDPSVYGSNYNGPSSTWIANDGEDDLSIILIDCIRTPKTDALEWIQDGQYQTIAGGQWPKGTLCISAWLVTVLATLLLKCCPRMLRLVSAFVT